MLEPIIETDDTVEEITTVQPAPVVKPKEATPEVKTEVVEESEIDYKAELEKEQKRLSQAEFTIQRLKAKKPIVAPEVVEEPIVEPVDTDLEERVAQRAEEIVNTRLQQFSADVFEDELNAITTDVNERELIKLKYQNVINRTGFTRQAIRFDLTQAQLLANAPKYQKQTREMVETLRAKKAITVTGAGSNQDPANGQQPDDLRKHFTERDWAFMKANKWSDEMIKKAMTPRPGIGMPQ